MDIEQMRQTMAPIWIHWDELARRKQSAWIRNRILDAQRWQRRHERWACGLYYHWSTSSMAPPLPLMRPTRWFYFALHRIHDDGTMNIHIDGNIPQEFPFGEEDSEQLRRLYSNLYDGPGPTNALWWGYVKALTPDAARYRASLHYGRS